MSEETKKAQEKFGALIESEYARIERMKADQEITDFASLEKIVIGVLPGDGVGPILMKEALRVLNNLLGPEIASGRIELREIQGMTIENGKAAVPARRRFRGDQEVQCPHQGADGDAKSRRTLAESDFCQQPFAPRSGAVCRSASHLHS